MCLAIRANTLPEVPSVNPEPKQQKKSLSLDAFLIFTLQGDCPARLNPDDLSDPSRYHKRLKEWLLRQK